MTRLLQTLVSSVTAPAPQLPLQVTPGPVDKVLNWDTTGPGMARQDLPTLSHRSMGLLQRPLRSAPATGQV